MSKVLGFRVTDEEERSIAEAYERVKQPGERGGYRTWMRRVVLREVQRICTTLVEREAFNKEHYEPCDNAECPIGCPDSHAVRVGE